MAVVSTKIVKMPECHAMCLSFKKKIANAKFAQFLWKNIWWWRHRIYLRAKRNLNFWGRVLPCIRYVYVGTTNLPLCYCNIFEKCLPICRDITGKIFSNYRFFEFQTKIFKKGKIKKTNKHFLIANECNVYFEFSHSWFSSFKAEFQNNFSYSVPYHV